MPKREIRQLDKMQKLLPHLDEHINRYHYVKDGDFGNKFQPRAFGFINGALSLLSLGYAAYRHSTKKDIAPFVAHEIFKRDILPTLPSGQAIIVRKEYEMVPGGGFYINDFKVLPSKEYIQDPHNKTVKYEYYEGSKLTNEQQKAIQEITDPSKTILNLKEGLTFQNKLKSITTADENWIENAINLIEEAIEKIQEDLNKRDNPEYFKLEEVPKDDALRISKEFDDIKSNIEDHIKKEPTATYNINHVSLEDLTPEQKELFYLLESTYRNQIELNRHYANELYKLYSTKPKIPPTPNYGPIQHPVTYEANDIRKLNNKKVEDGEAGLAQIFAGLLKSTKDLSSFYEMALTEIPTNDSVYSLMLLFGSFGEINKGVSIGNLALFANPLHPDGKFWSIVTDVQGNTAKEILVERNGSYQLLNKGFGQLILSWSATPCTLFIEQSDYGRFWGPQMLKFKEILNSSYIISNTYDLVKKITLNTRIYSESYESFIKKINSQLYAIDGRIPLYPGSIVLNDEPESIGIILSDGRILGVNSREGLQWRNMSFQEFQPIYIWYPHT